MRQFPESNKVIYDFITYIASGVDPPYDIGAAPARPPVDMTGQNPGFATVGQCAVC